MGQIEVDSEAAAIGHRIDALPGNGRLWAWIFMISVGGFFEVYDLALTAPLSAALAAAGIFHTGQNGLFGLADQATFIFATFLGLYVGMLVFAVFGDRLGRRKVFAWSLIWYAAATLILGLQDSVGAICFWRFIAGIGLGAEAVAIDCFLVELAPARLRGRIFAASRSIQYAAIPVAALLAALLAGHYPLGLAGWRWLCFLPVVGALGFWIMRQRLPESPRWLASQGRWAEANHILSLLDSGVHPSAPQTRSIAPTRVVAVEAHHVRTVVIVMLIYFNCQNIAYYGFANWLPTLLQAQGANFKDSLLYTAGVALASPLAPFALILIADRIERKHLIVASGLFSMTAGLLFAWAQSPLGWVGFGLVLALSNSVLATNSHNYISESFPTNVRARWTGFIYSFTRIAAAFSGYLIALVLANAGVKGVFVFLSGLMVVAVAIVAIFGARTRGVTFEGVPRKG